ncbi:MAG: hypothetical protein AAF349_18635 [Cyanobacteria bacterium P01_A01_bin.68]
MTQKRKRNYRAKFVRVSHWMIYTVGISSIPLLVSYFVLLNNPQFSQNPFENLSLKSDFLVVSGAIVGEATSELSRQIPKILKMYLNGFCILFILTISFLLSRLYNNNSNDILSSNLSIGFFVSALVIAFFCKIAGRS